MNAAIEFIWQFNIELSLILVAILLARFAVRKTTKNYNAYLLWLALPLAYMVAKLLRDIEFLTPKNEFISNAVQTFVVTPSQSISSYQWAYWILGFWSCISILLLGRLFYQHVKLRKQLNDIIIAGNIKYPKSKYPVLTIQEESLSPAVYGFIKPKIYFPIHVAKQLSEQQRSLIIQHEEHHISQKHLWLNLFWDIAVCLIWFNPLIYFSRQQFRHDQELFCDYLVLNNSNKDDQSSYGHALLSTVSATHSVSLLCSWKMFNQLEERIMNITKPVSGFKTKASMLLAGLIVVGSMSVYAANFERNKQSNNESFNHSVYDDGTTKIKWTINGKSYVNEDGDLYIIERSGKKRAMTKEEQKDFENAFVLSQKSLALSEQEFANAEKEIIEAEKEMLQAEKEMALVEQEMEHAQEALNRAHKEMALEKHQLSRQEEQRHEKARAHAHQEMMRAREEMMKSRKHMHKERVRLSEKALKLHKNKKMSLPAPPKPPKRAYPLPPRPERSSNMSVLPKPPAPRVNFPVRKPAKIESKSTHTDRINSENGGQGFRMHTTTQGGQSQFRQLSFAGQSYGNDQQGYYIIDQWGQRRTMSSSEQKRFLKEYERLQEEAQSGPVDLDSVFIAEK